MGRETAMESVMAPVTPDQVKMAFALCSNALEVFRGKCDCDTSLGVCSICTWRKDYRELLEEIIS